MKLEMKLPCPKSEAIESYEILLAVCRAEDAYLAVGYKLSLIHISTSVFPNTSWKSGGIPSVLAMKRSPVTGSNLPGACHSVACFSAGPNPFPLIVCRCRILGPCISLISRNTCLLYTSRCV